MVSPGLADEANLHDDPDAFGPLDIKTISHAHGKGDRLVHFIATYGRWGAKTLRSEDSDIQLLFTTDGDNKPERVLVVDNHQGFVRAVMHKWQKGIGKKTYGNARIRRTGPRAAKLVFSPGLLGKGVGEYGWHVDTRFSDEDHRRCTLRNGTIYVCPDSAPNETAPRAYLRHSTARVG
jgi:hypothetical protein